jgi:hypothetical protein
MVVNKMTCTFGGIREIARTVMQVQDHKLQGWKCKCRTMKSCTNGRQLKAKHV